MPESLFRWAINGQGRQLGEDNMGTLHTVQNLAVLGYTRAKAGTNMQGHCITERYQDGRSSLVKSMSAHYQQYKISLGCMRGREV